MTNEVAGEKDLMRKVTYRDLLIELTENLRHIDVEKLGAILDAPVRVQMVGRFAYLTGVEVEEPYQAEVDEDPGQTTTGGLIIYPWLT